MSLACSSCGFDNPDGMAFCGRCGEALEQACPQCGSRVPAEFRFCGRCGANLDVPSPPEVAERRQLTVMFCDLVGSTALSERLDPEDLHHLVRSYQRVSVEVAERFEGHVAQYLGDGILVYFGYPRAHEDDPRRAVHAGLGIVEAVGRLGGQLDLGTDLRLAVRVGIHTGPVVTGEVGSGGHVERLALGETPNVAARLQSLAAPDAVVVSADTWKRVEPWFTFERLGSRRLKGLSRPLEVFRAVRESHPTGVVDLRSLRGLEPPVGRDRELEELTGLLEPVRRGRGRVAVISGEAGIGKSCLLQAFEQRLLEAGFARLAGRTSPYQRNAALWPFQEILQQILELDPEDSPARRSERLARGLEGLLEGQGWPLQEAVPLLAAHLELPLPDTDRFTPLAWTSQRKRDRLLELARDLILIHARRRPTLMVLEDLHWADPSTLELLGLLVEDLADAPLLAVWTHRPGLSLPWEPPEHQTELVLDRLGEEGVKEIVRRVTGGRSLPPEVTAEIVRRTDGVPLFVEELTKMLLESGHLVAADGAWDLAAPLPDLTIPSTLQDSLMARLDRLGEAKAVAQLGAVLGRELSRELLSAVDVHPEPVLERSLRRLVEAELLVSREGGEVYTFRHALIQDTAYASLLRKTRRDLHGRIARTLQERFPDRAEAQPELLARHFAGAGEAAPAVDLLAVAAQRSLGRSANREALRQIERGLDVLAELPDGAETHRRELTLQAARGPALTALEGFGAPEVAAAHHRALELCGEVERSPELFWVTWGLWAFYFMRVELDQARSLAERLEELADSEDGIDLSMEAHYAVGATHFCLGEFGAAFRRLEQALAVESPEGTSAAIAATGQDLGVAARSYLAMTLWHLGRDDEATTRAREALDKARGDGQPFMLNLALLLTACLDQFRRDRSRVAIHAGESLELAREHGFFSAFQAEVLLGWGRVLDGAEFEEREKLLERMEGHWQQTRAAGALLSETHILSMVAEGHLAHGAPEVAHRLLDEALEAARQRGERYWEAELLRLRGEARKALGRDPRDDWGAARDVARGQGSRALERRVEKCLATLAA